MGDFLKVLGAMTLLFLLAIVVFVLTIRAKFRRLVRDLQERADQVREAFPKRGVHVRTVRSGPSGNHFREEVFVAGGGALEGAGGGVEEPAEDEDEFDEPPLDPHEQAELEALDALALELYRRYSEETTLTVPEWERARDHLVFIHDRLAPEMIEDIVSEWTGEEILVPDVPQAHAPARERFSSLNARLPEERRFVKLGKVAGPVEADVYRAPDPA